MIKNITRKDRKDYEAIVVSSFTYPEATSVEDRNTLIRLVIQLDKACSELRQRRVELEEQLEVALADAKANKFKGIITPEDLESE